MINVDVFVIGAGMAGLTLAKALSNAGINVACADKARGSGGRLSSKRINHSSGALSFDLGAAGFKAQTHEFKKSVNQWQQQGVVDFWYKHNDEPVYVGVPRSSSVTRAMVDELQVYFSTRISHIEKQNNKWQIYQQTQNGNELFASASQVVLAVPAPQACELIPENLALKSRLEKVSVASQWVMMLALSYPLDIQPLTTKPCACIESISYENSKPGRSSESGHFIYTIQATTDWSAQYINEPHDVIQALLIKELELALQSQLSIQSSYVHRWLYSQDSINGHEDTGYLQSDDNLFICGDYLLSELNLGGVESAFLSGLALAQYMIDQKQDLARVG